MSMPYNNLLCTRCEFRSASSRTWGSFDYLSESERYPVDRVLGWCHDCADFKPIEKLGCVEALTSALQSAERAMAKARYGVCKRLGLLIGLGRRALADLDRQRKEAAFALKLAHARQGQPRCLGCGSHRVEAVTMPHQAGPSGFVHPGCGGQIYVRPSDIRLHMAFEDKLYTEDGVRVK